MFSLDLPAATHHNQSFKKNRTRFSRDLTKRPKRFSRRLTAPLEKWELALLVSDEMPKAQLSPDVVTYNSAIAACNWDWERGERGQPITMGRVGVAVDAKKM